jgi:hypothetical protein
VTLCGFADNARDPKSPLAARSAMLVSKLKPNIATVHSAWGLSLYSAELLLLAYISTFNWEFQDFPTQDSINSHDAPVVGVPKTGSGGWGSLRG